MVQALLAFGANLGDRLSTLQAARAALAQAPGVTFTGVSSVYEAAAVGGPAGQGDYLNAVAACDTALSARDLLRLCLEVETGFGRRRRERWGPRTLDIDLLFYGDTISEDPDLLIPHPRIQHRAFVLVPLAEIAPELRHPVLGRTVSELLAVLDKTGGVRRLAAEW